jgi:hypothetical protein
MQPAGEVTRLTAPSSTATRPPAAPVLSARLNAGIRPGLGLYGSDHRSDIGQNTAAEGPGGLISEYELAA